MESAEVTFTTELLHATRLWSRSEDTVDPTSYSPHSEDRTVDMVAQVVEIILVFFGVLGNSLVIYCVWRFRVLHKPVNYLIASSCLNDIAGLVIFTPLEIDAYHRGVWSTGELGCFAHLNGYRICTFCSVWHVILITMCQFLHITRSKRLRFLNRKRAILIICLMVRIFPLSISLVYSLGLQEALIGPNNPFTYRHKVMLCLAPLMAKNDAVKLAHNLMMLVLFGPSGVAMLYFYGRIFSTVRKSNRRMNELEEASRMKRKRRQVMELRIVVIACAVLVSSLVSNALSPIILRLDPSGEWPSAIHAVVVIFRSLPFATNWVLFGLCGSVYRNCIYSIFFGIKVAPAMNLTSEATSKRLTEVSRQVPSTKIQVIHVQPSTSTA